jgi:hypothetical protein
LQQVGIDGAESILYAEERSGMSRIFERALWASRLLVLVAVVASVVLVIEVFQRALSLRYERAPDPSTWRRASCS